MVKTFLEEIHTIAQPLHDNGMSVQKSVEIAIEIIRAQRNKKLKTIREESKSQKHHFLPELIEAVKKGKIKIGKEYTATEIAKKINIINPTRGDATKVAKTIRDNFEYTARRGSAGERLIKISSKLEQPKKDQIEKARKIGLGNTSAGVRTALDEYEMKE